MKTNLIHNEKATGADNLWKDNLLYRHRYKGKLTIIDKPGCTLHYGVFNNDTAFIEMTNISDILNNIYQTSTSLEVGIKVECYDSKKNIWDDIFKAGGKLNFQDSNGVDDWFVGDKDLGSVLFENVGNKINIIICNCDGTDVTFY